jgi:hypothetical protein
LLYLKKLGTLSSPYKLPFLFQMDWDLDVSLITIFSSKSESDPGVSQLQLLVGHREQNISSMFSVFSSALMGLKLEILDGTSRICGVIFQAGRKETMNFNITKAVIFLLIMSVTEIRTSLAFFYYHNSVHGTREL